MPEKAQYSGKKRLWLLKFLLANCFAIVLPVLLIAPDSHSQSAKKLKAQEEEMRSYMIAISRQLGVSCTTCHITDNFKSDEKAHFKIAKDHMRLTQLLIDNGMDGKRGPKADCYMCHRGQLKPDYLEKLHPMLQEQDQFKKMKTGAEQP